MASSKYVDSSDQVAQYFEQNLSAEGELTAPGAHRDLCFYYKLPTLMLLSGRYKLANTVLNYIKVSL